MPARQLRLDEIGERLEEAAVVGMVSPACCFKDKRGKSCKEGATSIVALSYKDGHGELYLLCRSHSSAVLEEFPDRFVGSTSQTIFVS